jgi:hypothetical protein
LQRSAFVLDSFTLYLQLLSYTFSFFWHGFVSIVGMSPPHTAGKRTKLIPQGDAGSA